MGRITSIVVIQKGCTGVVQKGFFDHPREKMKLTISYSLLISLEPVNGLEPLTC